MRPELTRCPSCGMSVTTWVRDDNDVEDSLRAALAAMEWQSKQFEDGKLALAIRLDSASAALKELVEAHKGMNTSPNFRWQNAIAKAKEVLGNG